MVSFILFYIIGLMGEIGKSSAVELSYPLTSMDPDLINEFGIGTTNAWKDLMNGGSIGEYRTSGNYKWSNKLINIVDGVEYKNFGQFVKYIKNFVKILEDGSTKITKEPETTVFDENSLGVHFCFDMTLNLDIGIFDASTTINKCATRHSTFDNNMVLIKSEMTTDSELGGALFNYAVQLAITTVLPASINNDIANIDEHDVDDNDNPKVIRLLTNPVFLSIFGVIMFITLLTGIIVGCVITNVIQNSKKNKYLTVSTKDSASEQTEFLK